MRNEAEPSSPFMLAVEAVEQQQDQPSDLLAFERSLDFVNFALHPIVRIA